MKKKLPILLFILFTSNFYAQVNYEKSYFIDNNGNKTECFIKNKDKNDNPTYFEYKLKADDSQVITADIKTVKEFKISNVLKYERATVNLDTSKVNLDVLNENREPEWKEVTIFLKTIIESQASLYEYHNGNLKRYFYKIGNGAVEQLIYKRYILNEDLSTKVTVNKDFQKQLWQNVTCDNKNIDDVLKLNYTRKDLTNYFVEYNNCKKNDFTDFGKKLEKGSVNVKVLAGVTSSSLSFTNNYAKIEGEFDKKTNFTFGAEFEWILPVNRNKWSLFIAPTYNSYENSTKVSIYNTGPFGSDTEVQTWEASLSHLDIAVGFKYYMFISDNSKIFLEGSYIIPKVLNSDIHDERGAYDLEAKLSGRIGYGIGYSFKNKFNIELKHSSTNIFENYVFLESKYNMTSLVFGYTIFDSKKKK